MAANAHEGLQNRYKELAKVAKLAIKTYDPGALPEDDSAKVVGHAVKMERQMFRALHPDPNHTVVETEISRTECAWVGADIEYDISSTSLFCEVCQVYSVAWPHLVIGAAY